MCSRSKWIVAATIVVCALLILPASLQAQQFQVLHSFNGYDGGFPDATVTFDPNGNMYGTTFGGTVYEIDSAGAFQVLHTFTHHEGSGSESTLLRDASGNLYGTNSEGGLENLGTVFRLNQAGRLVVLVAWGKFGVGTLDGWDPIAGLVADRAGNLYGTTYSGGSRDMGTVYKVDHRTGAFTLLYSFGDPPDGCCPTGEVLLGQDGNLYGTLGGNGAFGWGSLFKVDPVAGTETVLYDFTGGADGALPGGNLIEDAQGNLYGTTYQGGTVKAGTIFRYDLATNTLTTIWNFGSNGTLGSYPFDGVVRDKQGNLYGTTYSGGFGYGNVYRLGADGIFTNLYSFSGGSDGRLSYAGVTLYKGSLYGTTQQGGAYGYGVVYKITP